MQKTNRYEFVRFSADVLREASDEFDKQVHQSDDTDSKYYLSVNLEDAEWQYEAIDEFLADYRKSNGGAHFSKTIGGGYELAVSVSSFYVGNGHHIETRVAVRAPDRAIIEAVLDVFERQVESNRIATPERSTDSQAKIFIGHGQSSVWRDLKDHLQDQHGYEVLAYETGARAGHAVRDILGGMLGESNFALVVMTAEDETAEGLLHPRLNVVHELGLFQGKLGFNRAIALVEEGTEDFSNISGIQQIRFSKANIRETFGDVLATLKREFPTETSER